MAAEDKTNAGKDQALPSEQTRHLDGEPVGIPFGGAPEVMPSKDAKVLYPARPWQADPSPWPSDEPPGGKPPPKP